MQKQVRVKEKNARGQPVDGEPEGVFMSEKL